MRRPLVVVLSFLLAAATAGGAHAKSMAVTQTQASRQIQDALGTWTCKSSEGTHTATFTPLMGGKGMQIVETGNGGSVDLVTFDVKKQKWIDQHVDAQSYGVMEGTPVKGGIKFTMVYPTGMTGGGSVMFPSKNMQVSNFYGVMNGKSVTMKETCTKK